MRPLTALLGLVLLAPGSAGIPHLERALTAATTPTRCEAVQGVLRSPAGGRR